MSILAQRLIQNNKPASGRQEGGYRIQCQSNLQFSHDGADDRLTGHAHDVGQL
jgi:hypothetical protein